MSLFNNPTHQHIWLEHHCHQCFHHRGRGCPIVQKALQSDRKPVEWERNPRKNVLMQDSIKCNVETRRPPPVGRAPKAFDDVPMFDVDTPTDMDGNHA